MSLLFRAACPSRWAKRLSEGLAPPGRRVWMNRASRPAWTRSQISSDRRSSGSYIERLLEHARRSRSLPADGDLNYRSSLPRRSSQQPDSRPSNRMDPTKSIVDQDPFVWMAEVNGMLVDIPEMPREVQVIACEKGTIPY